MVPPVAAFVINVVCIMLLMIMGCHNVIMYNHSTFVLRYLCYRDMMSQGMNI